MEAVVTFFERLVGESAWKRLALLSALIVVGLVGIRAYEVYTGHFQANRMQFAAEHLSKLADPELKKNIKGDEELERAHQMMKRDLNGFIERSQFDLSVPEQLSRGVAAFVPWLLIGIAMFTSRKGQDSVAISLVGLVGLSIPFVLLGAFLPAVTWWFNYIVYPFGSVLAFAVLALILQKPRKSPALPSSEGASKPVTRLAETESVSPSSRQGETDCPGQADQIRPGQTPEPRAVRSEPTLTH